MRHLKNKYIFLSIGFFVLGYILLPQKRKETSNIPFYLNPSPKEKLRRNYYETRHKSTSDWRKIEALNKKNKLKSALDTFLGTWYEIGSVNQAGRIHTIDYDANDNTILTASAGGHIWSYNRQTSNWKVLNDFNRIDDIVFLKVKNWNNKKYLFTASGSLNTGGFYSSTDGGTSFSKALGLGDLKYTGHIKKVVYTEQELKPLFYVLAEVLIDQEMHAQLFLSKDTGKTFNKIWFSLTNAGNWDITQGILQNGTAVLAGQSKISIIDTAGTETLLGNVQLQRYGEILVSAYRTNNLVVPYIAAFSAQTTDFYSKDITGWKLVSYVDESPFMVNSFSVSATNSNTLYFGGVNPYFSKDGGISWQKVSDWSDYYGNETNKLHADIPEINSMEVNGKELNIISCDGGLYSFDANFSNLQNLSLSGLNNSQYYSVVSSSLDNQKIVVGSQDQGLQESVTLQLKSKNHFVQKLSGDFGHIVTTDNLDHYWVVYPGFVAYSDNLDIRFSWKTSNQLWLPPIAQSLSKPNQILLAGVDSQGAAHLYKVKYENFTIKGEMIGYNFSASNKEQISAIQVSLYDDDMLFLMTSEGRFFSSKDGGATWAETNNFVGPKAQYFYGADILCSKQNAGKILIAGSGYEQNISPVYISRDSGQTFTPLDKGLPKTLINAMTFNNDEEIVFAAGESGAYAYFFKDSIWINISDSAAPDVPYWDVEFVPQLNTARFATYGRGVWDFELRSDIHLFPPVLKKILPDILVNRIDTLFTVYLDSFFYSLTQNQLIYTAYVQDTNMANINVYNNKELQITPRLKGRSRISVFTSVQKQEPVRFSAIRSARKRSSLRFTNFNASWYILRVCFLCSKRGPCGGRPAFFHAPCAVMACSR